MFKIANEDLIVARVSLEKEVYNQVCFHSHQGVEKMLKGYLAVKDKNIPTRYPDVLPGRLPEGLPKKEDAEEALAALEEIGDFINANLR